MSRFPLLFGVVYWFFRWFFIAGFLFTRRYLFPRGLGGLFEEPFFCKGLYFSFSKMGFPTIRAMKGASGHLPFFSQGTCQVERCFLCFDNVPIFFRGHRFYSVHVGVGQRFNVNDPFLRYFFPATLHGLCVQRLRKYFQSPVRVVNVRSMLGRYLYVKPLVVFIIQPTTNGGYSYVVSPPFFGYDRVTVSNFKHVSNFSNGRVVRRVRRNVFVKGDVSNSLRTLGYV